MSRSYCLGSRSESESKEEY